jgi:SAM-dependent methyltransferase
VPLNFVWEEGRTLTQCCGNKKYDYVVSSHVAEHVPDILGHLIEVWDVLSPGGKYIFVIPNPKGGGEYFRRLSTASDIINSFFQDKSCPSPGHIWEYMTSIVEYTGAPMAGKTIGDFRRLHTDQEALQDAIRCQETYVDVHCWAFTPEVFEKAFTELAKFQLDPFFAKEIIPSEVKTNDDECFEFTVIFERNDNFMLPERWKSFLTSREQQSTKQASLGHVPQSGSFFVKHNNVVDLRDRIMKGEYAHLNSSGVKQSANCGCFILKECESVIRYRFEHLNMSRAEQLFFAVGVSFSGKGARICDFSIVNGDVTDGHLWHVDEDDSQGCHWLTGTICTAQDTLTIYANCKGKGEVTFRIDSLVLVPIKETSSQMCVGVG